MLASWYGDAPTALRLGLQFHRSALDIVVSQVSTVPPQLSRRWDKKRRLAAAWESLDRLKPSQHLTTRTVGIGDAGAAFRRLMRADDIATVIRY